jgi:hypothetical protein
MPPFDFLQRIENARFPLTVTSTNDIRCVELLRAVGWIEATISPADQAADPQRSHSEACIEKITLLGMAAMERRRR